MSTVAQLLQEKGRAVWSIAPEATVYAALTLMAEKNVGALMVLEGSRVVGIISERDYARKVILKGKFSKDTLVREIMTDKVYFVRPEQTIEECMALMTAEHIRHLPVLADDQLVGVISIGDVVKVVISDKEFLIKQLEHYITGRRA
ncbi:MAG: CBS domain-containing protein [Anaerolineales bacterium]|nr:CBS domain-containing protein [Anaerolineales bacterium]